MDYGKYLNVNETPQGEAIPGKNMIKNEAGGFGFKKGAWERFQNFLVLGSEGGTYYVKERELTLQNAENLINCIKENGPLAVGLIVGVSSAGRAPKNDPAIFALALTAIHGDEETKKLARNSIHLVCRTGTHLFNFLSAYKKMGGKTSRQFKRGVQNFYLKKTPDQVALQLVKYRQRNGFTHRDVLRMCHAPGKPGSPLQNLFRFAIEKPMEGEVHPLVSAFQRLHAAGKDEKMAVKIMKEAKLPWEAVPTELLNSKKVWEELLPHMGVTALIRNLGKLTSIGMLESNLDDTAKYISKRIEDTDALKKGRVHPFQILLAYSTYEAGRGVKGSLSWTPVSRILDSLDSAFFASFPNIQPTEKNLMVGVDVSGSMTTAMINNTHLTAAAAAFIMGYIHMKTERNVAFVAFDDAPAKINFPAKATLSELLAKSRSFSGGSTDCSVPFKAAIGLKLKVDAFIIYTDSQTWCGVRHPVQVFEEYRKRGYPSKAIGVEMTSTATSIVDPECKEMLSIVGMDTNVPSVINNFIVEEKKLDS